MILLIDGSTEIPALRATLLELWQEMNAASPNATRPRATLQLLEVEGSAAAGVRRLLELCDVWWPPQARRRRARQPPESCMLQRSRWQASLV